MDLSRTADAVKRRATALARDVTWIHVRYIAFAAYLVVLAAYLWREGVPTWHVSQYLWIIIGLGTLCIGQPLRTWRRLVVSWTVFFGVFVAYDYSRGMAYHYTGPAINGFPAEGAINTFGAPLHVTFPIDVDQFLFGGTLPTHWVQAHLHPGHTIALVAVLVSLTYLTHFLVTPALAIVLWLRRSRLFTTWLVLALTLAIVGLTGYFLFPMSPPWLASRQGYIAGPPVLTLTGEGWQVLGLRFASSVVDYGRALANPVAAMPSLHLAFAALASGFLFFATKRTWVKIVIWLYPLAMGVSLIYGGEHYVTDEIAGVLCAGIIIAGWRVWEWRRRLRAARDDAPPVGLEPTTARLTVGSSAN